MIPTLPTEVSASITHYQEFLRKNKIALPSLHVVLGSGLGSSLESTWIPESWQAVGELHFAELPAIAAASAPGHAGIYRFYCEEVSGKVLCLQVGRLHGYEGLTAEQVVLPVTIPRFAGTTNFILTNAAGGLKLEWSVGSAMMIRDHVNFTGQNPLIGPMRNLPSGGPVGLRFPDFSKAWDREFTDAVRRELTKAGMETHDGIYLGVLGPNFETPAEIRLFSQWGMGTVGMSTVWEAIALVHSGARLAGISLISNLGSGLNPGVVLNHAEILETSRASAERIIRAVFSLAGRDTIRL